MKSFQKKERSRNYMMRLDIKKNKNVIAIIPARGGSKGIPMKNIAFLRGKPLIAHTIEAAKRCRFIDRVVVSTDNRKIAKTAKKYGAEVPFMRPRKFSTDSSPSIDVLKHAVKWLEENEDYKADIVVYMQPTDIFRKDYMLDEVIGRLLANGKLDSVFVGYKTHKNFWRKTSDGYEILAPDIDRSVVRQYKEPIYREDASLVSATRAGLIKKGIKLGKSVDIVINEDFETSIDIHEPFDLWLAEKVLEKREKDGDSK